MISVFIIGFLRWSSQNAGNRRDRVQQCTTTPWFANIFRSGKVEREILEEYQNLSVSLSVSSSATQPLYPSLNHISKMTSTRRPWSICHCRDMDLLVWPFCVCQTQSFTFAGKWYTSTLVLDFFMWLAMKMFGTIGPGSFIHKLYGLRSPNSQPSELGNLTILVLVIFEKWLSDG